MLTEKEFKEKVVSLDRYINYWALWWTGDPDRAKDLVQEVYIRIWINRDKFDGKNLKAWIFAVIKNLFLNDEEKHKRQQTIFFNIDEDMGSYDMPAMSSDIGNPETDFEEKQICETIDSLSDNYRIPLVLKNAGYSMEEIGEQLNLNTGTVKARIHKARCIVKDKFSYKMKGSSVMSALIGLLSGFIEYMVLLFVIF